MRTALTLDPDVFEAAQALARGSGKRLGRVVSDLARRGLRIRATPTEPSGLPVFAVPADGPVIPSDRATALLASVRYCGRAESPSARCRQSITRTTSEPARVS